MERFYLKSFGCKVNQYDGQSLREQLRQGGLEEVLTWREADLVALIFCVVTQRAASRCFRALKSLYRQQPGARFIVAGCLSPDDQARVRDACPEAILLSDGTESKVLSNLLSREVPESCWGGVSGLRGHTRAFLKVQDGCNMRCAYCIIPSIRGRERSRPLAEVLEEASRLLEAGYKELVLCGIRLGGYHWEGKKLPDLLATLLEKHKGGYRIRLSSLNPAEVTSPLLDIMGSDPRVARHLHLPLQSGDPGVLKRMRRPYSPFRYLDKIEEVRSRLPDPALSTDLMVGFPGEDESAFQASLNTLKKARVSRVHVFPYSPRGGTEAAQQSPVSDEVKKVRTRLALRVAASLKEAFDRSFIGCKASVLVETNRDRTTGDPVGLTSRYQKTALNPSPPGLSRGTFVTVILESYQDGLFQGRVMESTPDET
jgi:threonylcarbamoyladenosine tRNA methylthiotransferase MtaB